MRALLVPFVAVALMALAACDDDTLQQNDDAPPERSIVEPGLARLYAGGLSGADVEAESACFATGLLDALTLDDLVDAGVVGDDGVVVETAPMLTVDVATAWVDAAGACAPYPEVAARAEALRTPGLDEAGFARCLDAAVEPARVHEALVASLSGRFDTDPAAAELTAAQESCR
ncbi:hypothetical protein ABFT23_11020 [Nocardioides sp. C4-1]|uniref:hypothetical protein n=1 Tax=Nocardioides sp. C4-1 TaxID=3151851 RepID=UPI0032672109